MHLAAYHPIQSDAAFGAWLSLHRLLGTYPLLGTYLLINPWCACAARVTVLGLCVFVSVTQHLTFHVIIHATNSTNLLSGG